MRFASVCLLALLAGRASAQPDGEGILIDHATIYTAKDGETAPIKDAKLVVKGGKIVGVYKAGDKSAEVVNAKKFTVIDGTGLVVIPGLVDTHSHIGLYPKPSVPAHADGNEMSGPVQPGVRAIDAIWPDDPGIRMAQAGGVTTANIMPGSGNVIGGQTLYVKLRGTSADEMRVTGKSGEVEILGGLKMANGENPKGYGRTKQQAPFTRMKIAQLQREQFVKAKEYQAKRKADPAKTPRDLGLDPLVEVLEKKRTVHFHCHRADDLLTAIRISEEFGFELVLQHATEGYRIAPLLAEKKIAVSLTLVDSPGGKAETMGLLDENAAELTKVGVRVTVNTDDYITESRFYLRTVAHAVRGGLTPAEALRCVTSNAAKVLHLDHRLGTLEAGKDADFVILSGEPTSVYTQVVATYIDGKPVFDRTKPSDRAYQVGGFAKAGSMLDTPMKVDAPKPAELPKVPAGDVTDAKLVPGLFYVRAGRIHTGSGEPIADGALVIRDGKIEKIGKAADVPRPAGARLHVANEVTPGFIDAGTTAGISGAYNIPADQDQDELGEPNQSDLRVIDGFNPGEPLLEFLAAQGVTTVHATPGRQAVLAGTTGVFRTRAASLSTAVMNPAFALYVNLGEVVKGKPKGPSTRMGTASAIRKALIEAQNPPKKDGPPASVALTEALAGKRLVVFAAHRADDIRTAIRIADEFKLKAAIALGTEADLVASELAERKIPVIIHPTMQRPGDSMETLNSRVALVSHLKAKGVTVVMGTGFEGYVPKQRVLRSEIAMAAAYGLGHGAAIQMATQDAAAFLGIDKEVGTLEVGKVADVVLYDGDPLEHATHVRLTFAGGRVVYDRAEYEKLPLERRALYHQGSLTGGVGCCMGW